MTVSDLGDAAAEIPAAETSADELPTEDSSTDEVPAEEGAPLPTFVVMRLETVEVALPSQFPVITLQEAEAPFRQLSLPIGMAEGVALAYAHQQVPTPRPLTHELMATVLGRYHVDVIAVRLIGRERGTYLAELDLMGPQAREIVPCRVTDGVTLAHRVGVTAPILCDVRLLESGDDVTP
jgi:bifunctional DNase/RNase